MIVIASSNRTLFFIRRFIDVSFIHSSRLLHQPVAMEKTLQLRDGIHTRPYLCGSPWGRKHVWSSTLQMPKVFKCNRRDEINHVNAGKCCVLCTRFIYMNRKATSKWQGREARLPRHDNVEASADDDVSRYLVDLNAVYYGRPFLISYRTYIEAVYVNRSYICQYPHKKWR